MGVVVVDRRAARVGERDHDVRVALLERDADAGERAAGADRGDEAVDLAVGLAPDLGPGALDVGLAVGGIVELVGPDRAVRLLGGELLGEPARVAHVVVGVLVRHGRHQDQLGAAQEKHVLLLLALRLRHHDHRAVAERVADQRQADAGVAGGALDDRAARAQQAAALGVAHDPQRRPVLDRLAGVEELGLAEDRAAGLLRGPPQQDQGRVADQIDEALLFHELRACARCPGAEPSRPAAPAQAIRVSRPRPLSRRRARRAPWARAASRKSSRSPSSTPWALPFSTPVRRSLTIW